MTPKLGQVHCFYELCRGQFLQKLNQSQILKKEFDYGLWPQNLGQAHWPQKLYEGY